MRIVPTYFTLPDLISLVIFSEGYKIRTSSYCNILYLPLTNYLIVPNILLNILFSESVLQQYASSHLRKNPQEKF